MSLLELFIEVDDFYQEFESWVARQQLPGKAKRGPKPSLSVSEVMTLAIHFHQAGYRDFKHYYQNHVCKYLAAEFPSLVSYGRFVELTRASAPKIAIFRKLNSLIERFFDVDKFNPFPLRIETKVSVSSDLFGEAKASGH